MLAGDWCWSVLPPKFLRTAAGSATGSIICLPVCLSVVAIATPSPGLATPLQNSAPAPVPAMPARTVPVSPLATPTGATPTGVAPGELDEAYTLGAGDRIALEIFNVPEYTGEMQVAVDGSVTLPLAGSVSVRGLRLRQAAEAIAQAYSQYLRQPVVTVQLIAPRPLQIGVSGEVNRPGSYAISLVAAAGGGTELQWPTITKAIELAGGITSKANVRSIQIHRMQQAGQKEVINIDLWQLLAGNLQQDIKLRDEDTIVIPTASQIDPAEATRLAAASFSPATIRINVVGEVVTPGVVEVPPNTPLNQALLAAGGFDNRRASKGQVQLVRLNQDGSVAQRTIPVDLRQGISEENNPILYNNDVIVVGRSGSARFTDAIGGVLETIGRIFPVFGLFR